ncbi:MAG: hypothetical protein ABFC18_02385 [Rikenellaceae bacterium]
MRLRSIPKVNVEFGLVALAHNLKKIAKIKDHLIPELKFIR